MKMLRRVTVLRRRARAVAVPAGLAATVSLAISLAVAPTADAATTGSGGQLMRGIDISAYQHADGPIDWPLLAREGIGFAGVKVTESTYYTNPYYLPDALAAARAGLAVLPYVFANPKRASGADTASFAMSAARYRQGSGALPFVLDLENDPYSSSDCYWLGSRQMIAWIAEFTTRIRALTGAWPIIYSTAAWWQECTQSTGRFSADPLWLADYNGHWPSAPRPWHRSAFWQYTSEGFLGGIGRTDLDYYQPVSGLPSLRRAVTQKQKHLRKGSKSANRGEPGKAKSATNH